NSTSSTTPPADYTGRTIQLGAVLSITGAGSVFGPAQKNAIELAVETINSSGGVNGGKIAVDVQDDASVPQQGLDAMTAQVQTKKVLGIIGPSLSIVAALAHPALNRLKTPVIAPSETGKGIVGSCAYPCDYIFRDSLGEALAIPDNVKDARDRYHPRSAAVLSATDDKTSAEGSALFQQAFADNGIAVAAGAAVAFSKNESVFTDYVTAALAKKPDVLAVSSPGAIAAALVAEARKQGFSGPILGTDAFNNAVVSQLAGAGAKGAQSATAYFPGLDTTAAKGFVSAYSARYKDAQGKPLPPDEVAAQAYVAVQLFAEAARSANLKFGDPTGDRTRLRDALAKVGVDTPMGPVSFTSTHDVRQDVYIMAMDGKGGFTLLNTVGSQ
ncbi:MAG: branched-chain amino acid transport system substrate-binding protein, partial [Chloroflexota bacterium]|nr:branched-chain amino acid transport system substrate-binding protein [Chloroflexota bacterium]